MGKICVLGSGGDAPGMNACIESVYRAAAAAGMETWAAWDGLNGLVEDKLVLMNDANGTCISDRAGCIFKCGRSPRFMAREGITAALNNIKKRKFDAVIILGGNGSLIGAGRLKNAGIPVVFIPATIDNDVPGLKHSLGFSSACEGSVEMVDYLRATMETSQRDQMVQLMGRHCNELAITVGAATFADIIDMEGQRYTPEQVAKIFKDNRKRGKMSNLLIMQERKGTDAVTDAIEAAKYLDAVQKAANDTSIRMTTLGFLQRGVKPSCRDRYLGAVYGRAAIDCVLKKRFGVGITMMNDQICYIEVELKPIFND